MITPRQRIANACATDGHAMLTAAARSYRHLTPEQRAESERLIALPHGAEDFALRRFVAKHHPSQTVSHRGKPGLQVITTVHTVKACEEAGCGIDRALPDAETLTSGRRLAPEIQAAWSLAALCHRLGDLIGAGSDTGAMANRLGDVERLAADVVAAARDIAAGHARPRAGARPSGSATMQLEGQADSFVDELAAGASQIGGRS